MSQSFSIDPRLSAELLGHINRGVFDRGVFAVPGDSIRSGTSTTPLGERVQPGDLITADLINFILARLDELEKRPTPTPTITPTLPTLTFVPTVPTLTFPTIFTINPTIFTMPTATFGPTGPVFTMPTGSVFTMVPTLTMGPAGPVLTMSPAFTIGPGNVATAATGLATGPGGLGNLGGLAGGGTLRREESVNVLPGIGRDEQTRLTNAGIRDLGAVADADPVVLGNALGVEPASAARMIGIARGALGPR